MRSAKRSGSSAQFVVSHDDLLTEVLLRLPIKSLYKFKCVCKHWLSLIEEPYFTRRKCLKSNTISALYVNGCSPVTGRYYEVVPLDSSQKRATFKHFNFAGTPHGIGILHSCSGLFLCRSLGEDEYFVYNPATKHFKTLPLFRATKQVLGFNLAFDPSKSRFYKVVCIEGSRSSHHGCRIVIHSSETVCGGWRVAGAPFTAPPSVEFTGGVCWNGAIHWTSGKDASLYFDLKEELVREMPMPPFFHGELRRPRYLGESGGHLHLVDFSTDLTTHFYVYEMAKDRSSWFIKFRVDQNEFDRFIPPCWSMCPISVLCVVRGEKEEDSFMVVYVSNGKIIRYNFVRQTHEEIRDDDSRPIYGWPFAYPYIDSLSLVEG